MLFRPQTRAMTLSYKEAVQKLNSLQTNASVLEQVRKVGARMNERSLPEMAHYIHRIGYKPSDFDTLNIIHVTGTKGKGSTCAFVQSILRHFPSDRPLRTGLFSSPHLIAVRERIRINGEPLSEESFARYSEYVWNRLEETKDLPVPPEALPHDSEELAKAAIKDTRQHPDKPTYFRYLALLALHTFMQEKVDVAILEVGVGGEYDATNVIHKPVVCGITALGLDHVSVLGNTIDQIAWHKAGIIKPHVPVVTCDQPPEAMAVIKQRAKDKDAPLTIVSDKDALSQVLLGLAGAHQRDNALVAVELCKTWLASQRMLPDRDGNHSSNNDSNDNNTSSVPAEFLPGLERVHWPGRAQTLPIRDTQFASKSDAITWYLDGAHTAESLDVCATWFNDTTHAARRVLVFNCTHGRDGHRLLNVMARLANQRAFDHVVFTTNTIYRAGDTTDNTNRTVTAAEANAVQRQLADTWAALVPTFASDRIHLVPCVEDAVHWAIDYQGREKETLDVLTTGSLILVGNTMTVLGLPSQ